MPNVIVVRNDYPDSASLMRVIDYVQRSQMGGGYAIDPAFAFPQMMLVKKAFHKTRGLQLKHFVISFTNNEVGVLDFDDLLNLGFQIGILFQEYQMIYNIHLDSEHVHLHFIMNTVSFLDGHKYSDGFVGFRKIRNFLLDHYPRFHSDIFLSDRYDELHPYKTDKMNVFE